MHTHTSVVRQCNDSNYVIVRRASNDVKVNVQTGQTNDPAFIDIIILLAAIVRTEAHGKTIRMDHCICSVGLDYSSLQNVICQCAKIKIIIICHENNDDHDDSRSDG